MQLPLYSGVVNVATSATKNSIAQRDANGSLTANGLSANTYLATDGAFYGEVATISTATTISSTPAFTTVLCNAASAAFAITLPPSAAVAGLTLSFKKTDSSGNAITLQANASEHIDGSNTNASLSAQYDVLRIANDGTQWWILYVEAHIPKSCACGSTDIAYARVLKESARGDRLQAWRSVVCAECGLGRTEIVVTAPEAAQPMVK